MDHTRVYTPAEKLDLALSHYHAALQQYHVNPETNKKPVILKIGRAYQVSEATLRWRIKNPTRNRERAQTLTPVEEKALIGRFQFLDDCNVPADRETVYSLAQTLLHYTAENQDECWDNACWIDF